MIVDLLSKYAECDGVLLSGGIDSTLVAYAARRIGHGARRVEAGGGRVRARMEIRKERGLVVVELGEAHRAISSLPTPPQIARIAFKQVDKDFSDTYEAEAARVRKALGEDTAVFLTAAKLPESFGVRAEGPVSAAATVAMGVENFSGI